LILVKIQLMGRFILKQRIGGMNLLEICLILATITIPFDYLWNSYAIVLFAAASLLSTSLEKKIDYLRKNKIYWILPLSFFIWITISLIWDRGSAFSTSVVEIWEGHVSWFVFPILFITIDKINPQSIKKILFSFLATNIVASVYCLWKAYEQYQATKYINRLFYHRLSAHIGINAIYFSLYCVFSIYILLFYFLFKRKKMLLNFLTLLCIGYLTIFVVLLSSKTLIFLLYLSALVFTVYSFYYFRSKLVALIMSVLLIAIPVLAIKFSYVKSRISDTQIKEYNGPEDNQNGFAVRGVLWESSWDLIRSRPLIGWGRFEAQDALQIKYLEMGFAEGKKENYNSHNQYIYTWLCWGLIGLALLLMYLGLHLRAFFRSRHFLGISLLLLFILANMTECMFEVQKGIVFFFLFSNLLLFHGTERHTEKIVS